MCVVIINTKWFENCKEKVSGFLPLRRKVSWIILAKFRKCYYRWLSYRCKWEVLILIRVNISEKNPSDEIEWSWVRVLNENLRRKMQDWRNHTNTQAEPRFWFRLVRWAKFWSTQKMHWRNPIFGSASSARSEKSGSPLFWPSRRFSNFSKTPKNKTLYHIWLGNARNGCRNTLTDRLWPGASEFHYT